MDILTLGLDWIEANPYWAGVAVMFIAFSESLALVGLFLPGAVMMFGIGALVGTGVLPLLPTLAWAAAGAIAGDGVSFWLGRHYHEQIRNIWPFSRYPQLLQRSIDYFDKHGGKSVLLGRFVGPIRPIIPVVAGMMEMPPSRFLVVNVISGICWAPVYVFPGIVFSATLGLAAEVATRLAFIGSILILVVIIAYWAVHRLFNLLHPRTHSFISTILAWSSRHPVVGEMPAALLDPKHPEAKGLSMLAIVILLAAVVYAIALQTIGQHGLLPNLDDYLFRLMQSLRTPAMDQILLILKGFGDLPLLVVFNVALFMWLWLRRYREAAKHWLAALALAIVLPPLLAFGIDSARPDSSPWLDGHISHAVITFGFLAIIIAREVSDSWRWWVYALGSIPVVMVAFAHLYLGAWWFSEILGGLLLGLAWVALVGIAYRRHEAGAIRIKRFAIGVTLLLLLLVPIQGRYNLEYDGPRYQRVSEPVTTISEQEWLRTAWQQLPAFRNELRAVRRHPLTLQFAGSLTALQSHLLENGWQQPVELNAYSWLRWLNTRTTIAEVPLLPQVHDGRNESLLLIQPSSENAKLLALRLWPGDVQLQNGQAIYVGNVSYLHSSNIPGSTIPETVEQFNDPLQQFAQQHGSLITQKVESESHRKDWNGERLLLQLGR